MVETSLGGGGSKSCPEAMDVFESLKKSGAELNSVVYNTVLDVRNTQFFFWQKNELIRNQISTFNSGSF